MFFATRRHSKNPISIFLQKTKTHFFQNYSNPTVLQSTVFLHIFSQNEFLDYWSHLCGYFLMICYDASTYFHFIISLNRFLAVFTPVLYHKMFSITFTKLIVMATYLLSFILITLFFQICKFSYYQLKKPSHLFSGLPELLQRRIPSISIFRWGNL